MDIDLNRKYKPSEDVVGREVHGEFLIIPITADISADEIFALNESGHEIWSRLDGRKTLKAIGREIMAEYEVTQEQLDRDLAGIVGALLEKKILVRV